MNVNVSLMIKNVIQIKSGIKINVGASVKIQKNIVCARKVIFEILLHVVVKMRNRSVISSNSLNDLSNKVCVPRKTENFNMFST